MTTFLTWNINNKKTQLLYKVLLEIINENPIDVIILQEAYGFHIKTILNYQYEEILYPENGYGSGVRIFLKKDIFHHYSVKRTKNKKLVFVHLKNKLNEEEFNLAAVHLHSKVRNTKRQQLWKNLPLIQKILEFERTSSNNDRTILVGDFNQNPYELDLCDPNMINGFENKKLISTLISNPKLEKMHNLWYNPMWNLMGDFDYKTKGERITGTFYRYTEDETPIWNLVDGFILRPSIMDKVDYNKTEIIIRTECEEFLKPFIIRKDESLIKDDLSDHLPIKFTLTLN